MTGPNVLHLDGDNFKIFKKIILTMCGLRKSSRRKQNKTNILIIAKIKKSKVQDFRKSG